MGDSLVQKTLTPVLTYSHFNKELRQVFLAITRVWCRKSFPSLFEMTITISPDQVKHGLLSKYLTDQLKHP